MNLRHLGTYALVSALAGIALLVTPLLAEEPAASWGDKEDAIARPVQFNLTDEDTGLAPVEDFASSELVTAADAMDSPPPCDKCGPGKKCTCKELKALKKKVSGAHNVLFYRNNFDYLCDPCYDDWHIGDALKRRGVGDWITLDVGGQFRMRQHSERNMRGLGLTGRDDDFLLYRTRLYTNVEVGDRFRFFGEMIDANSEYENFLPRPIEVNRVDALNLFGDFKLLDGCRGDLWARVGRQELLYGDQRTISPLDWANTRRTFDGVKLLWQGANWDMDAFYTRPVFPNATHFDNPDYDREFMGAYLTYKKLKRSKLDLYYLAYNNSGANDFNYDTVGARLKGGEGPWLWDLEGAYQGGNSRGFNHDAGFYTLGLGRKLECVRWTPTFWAYYDWASGDDVIGNGYDHLFPLAHKYMGFMDLFGRRNLEDWNLLLTLNPHQRVKLLLWYHIFHLENMNDVPYNVNMSPFNPGNLPGSSSLGKELDTIVSFTITPRMNLLFGYSQFFAGDYYFTTPGVPYAGDASFFYTQFIVNF